MSWIASVYSTSVGKKAVMALSGIVLFGFVLGHMAGNLKLYLGPESLNHYAEFLRTAGSPLLPAGAGLWMARGVLLACLVAHVGSAYALTMQSRAARPVGYGREEALASTYASRTMRFGGIIIFLFVVYHLLHLTTGGVHPDFRHDDVYHNVVAGFRVLPVSFFYIVAQVALAFHLEHGLYSLMQSLGWSHPRFNPARRVFSRTFAIVVAAGNISFPLAVLTGVVS